MQDLMVELGVAGVRLALENIDVAPGGISAMDAAVLFFNIDPMTGQPPTRERIMASAQGVATGAIMQGAMGAGSR